MTKRDLEKMFVGKKVVLIDTGQITRKISATCTAIGEGGDKEFPYYIELDGTFCYAIDPTRSTSTSCEGPVAGYFDTIRNITLVLE